ncbi:hypothetical protein VTI74DRAFT_3490 [Chaetomium olivicolor]
MVGLRVNDNVVWDLVAYVWYHCGTCHQSQEEIHELIAREHSSQFDIRPSSSPYSPDSRPPYGRCHVWPRAQDNVPHPLASCTHLSPERFDNVTKPSVQIIESTLGLYPVASLIPASTSNAQSVLAI